MKEVLLTTELKKYDAKASFITYFSHSFLNCIKGVKWHIPRRQQKVFTAGFDNQVDVKK